jgi:hypothetical protein
VCSPDFELFFARNFFDFQALHVLLLRDAGNIIRNRRHAALCGCRSARAHHEPDSALENEQQAAAAAGGGGGRRRWGGE